MSAWIVEIKTMDRVVSAIASSSWNGTIFHGFNFESAEGKDKIGRALFRANYKAVRSRYSHVDGLLPGQHPTKHPQTMYRHTSREVSKIQQLKSCNCLHYQMSEGRVPDSKIYKELETVINRLQSEVIADLGTYDAADWG